MTSSNPCIKVEQSTRYGKSRLLASGVIGMEDSRLWQHPDQAPAASTSDLTSIGTWGRRDTPPH